MFFAGQIVVNGTRSSRCAGIDGANALRVFVLLPAVAECLHLFKTFAPISSIVPTYLEVFIFLKTSGFANPTVPRILFHVLTVTGKGNSYSWKEYETYTPMLESVGRI